MPTSFVLIRTHKAREVAQMLLLLPLPPLLLRLLMMLPSRMSEKRIPFEPHRNCWVLPRKHADMSRVMESCRAVVDLYLPRPGGMSVTAMPVGLLDPSRLHLEGSERHEWVT